MNMNMNSLSFTIKFNVDTSVRYARIDCGYLFNNNFDVCPTIIDEDYVNGFVLDFTNLEPCLFNHYVSCIYDTLVERFDINSSEVVNRYMMMISSSIKDIMKIEIESEIDARVGLLKTQIEYINSCNDILEHRYSLNELFARL